MFVLSPCLRLYYLHVRIVKRKLKVLACGNKKGYYHRMDITEFASMGGKARAKRLTARQRSEQARTAVNFRWERVRAAAAKKAAAKAARKPRARKAA